MPQLRNQLVAVIDSRTTMVCLAAAGQIQEEGEPFHTLMGDFWQPPFHVHCRTMMVPYMPGFVNEQRKQANAELRHRPMKRRDRELARMPPRAQHSLPVIRGGMGDAIDPNVTRWVDELGERPLSRVPQEFRGRVVIHSPRFKTVPTKTFAGKIERYDVTDTVSGRKYIMQLEDQDAAKVEYLHDVLALEDGLPSPRIMVAGDADDSVRMWVMHQDVRDWDVDGNIRYDVNRWLDLDDRQPSDPLRVIVSDYVDGTSSRSDAAIGLVHDRSGSRLVTLGHQDSKLVDFDGTLDDFLDESADHRRLMDVIERTPQAQREFVLDDYERLRRELQWGIDDNVRQAAAGLGRDFDDSERALEILNQMKKRIDSLPTARELRGTLGWTRRIDGVDLPTRVEGELRGIVSNEHKRLTAMGDLGDELDSGDGLKDLTSQRIAARLRAADDAEDTFADLGDGLARGMADRYRHVDQYHRADDVGDWRLMGPAEHGDNALVWGDNMTQAQVRDVLQDEIDHHGSIYVSKKIRSGGVEPASRTYESVDDLMDDLHDRVRAGSSYLDDMYEVQIHGNNAHLQQLLPGEQAGYRHIAVDAHRTAEELEDEIVSRWVRLWAGTSGDGSPHSLAVQKLAAREFGLKNARDPMESYRKYMTNSKFERTWRDTQELMDRAGPAIRRFLRAQYDETQDQLILMGIDEVGLVRGVSQLTLASGQGRLTLNPISSFATRQGGAQRFSDGTLIWVVVPRERILGFPGRGYGCRHEDEIVVLGGPDGHYDFAWVTNE